MAMKINWNKVGWGLICLAIIINFVLLLRINKQGPMDTKPLGTIKLEKPTLFVIFNEFECASCVEGLSFLNDLYLDIKQGEKIDFFGIILSENKTDSKRIETAFAFPFLVTDDFSILSRLNMNRTPIIIGLSKDHRIFFSDVVPMGTGITPEFLKKGALDRLYYSIL